MREIERMGQRQKQNKNISQRQIVRKKEKIAHKYEILKLFVNNRFVFKSYSHNSFAKPYLNENQFYHFLPNDV